ncbi:MAG: hypothetical protein PHP64_05435 [Actinomycetota bacterium]|nr:hypothetical protein [Actinomycetota bacterium]
MKESGISKPSFLEGEEVAVSKRLKLKDSGDQLPFPEEEQEVRKKFQVAILIVTSVFLVGIFTGVILGFFI